MSRNLMRTDCDFCQGVVALVEEPRRVTREDVGGYFETRGGFGFAGMVAAHAACIDCEAQYLAWVSVDDCDGYRGQLGGCPDGCRFFDLSFRSTFNDEPGPEDMPRWRVERVVAATTTRHPIDAPA